MDLNKTMDTSKLISDIRLRFQQNESKLYLQEKYKNRLHFACQGGMWMVTPPFLAFLTAAPEEIILEDCYNNPVKVNTRNLYTNAMEVYTSVMQEWHSEYQELVKNR